MTNIALSGDDALSHVRCYQQINTTKVLKVFLFTKLRWMKKPIFLLLDGAILEHQSGHVAMIIPDDLWSLSRIKHYLENVRRIPAYVARRIHLRFCNFNFNTLQDNKKTVCDLKSAPCYNRALDTRGPASGWVKPFFQFADTSTMPECHSIIYLWNLSHFKELMENRWGISCLYFEI